MTRRAWVIGAVVLLASACARDPKQAAAKFVASGDAFVARQQFKEATIEYRNALERQPRDAAIEVKLAHAYEQAKDVPAAYRHYLRATELDERRIDARAWLAEFLVRNGQFDEARRHARAVLEIDPKQVQALIVLASAEAAMRDRGAALEWVQKALAIDPSSATAHSLLGALELGAGDRARAKAAFVKATELAPSSPDAWIALAQFDVATGEFAAAEKALTKALDVASDKAGVHRLIAMFDVGVGRAAEAEPHLKQVAEAGASGRILLADYYAAAARNSEALAELDRVVADKTAPRETVALAHLRRAAVRHTTGERDKAHQELARLFDNDQLGADAHVLKAQLIMRERGDLGEALTHAREAMTRRPNDPAVLYVLATVHLARGDLAEAEAPLRRARDAAPQSPMIELQLGRLLLAKGDYRGAGESAKRVLASAPSAEAVALQAQAARLSGDLPRARQIVNAALAAAPSATALYAELGDVELAARRPDAARAAYERALAAKENTPRARRGLIAADLAAKRTADADARIRQWSADAPSAPDLPLLAATVHLSAGNQQAALADYERAAAANPRSAGVFTAIGMLKAEGGDRPGAQSAYERALQLDADDGVAANNLAWIYAAQDRTGEALGLAQVAHKALAGKPAALDTLGWMYYLQNSAAAGIPFLSRAADADPRNAVYRYHLGAALLKANQRERGRRELQQALVLSTAFDGAGDAKRLLNER